MPLPYNFQTLDLSGYPQDEQGNYIVPSQLLDENFAYLLSRVYIGSSAPVDTDKYIIWIDTSLSPARVKVYSGTTWVNAGSNAGTLDGYSASQTPGANRIPIAKSDGKLDSGWIPPTGSVQINEAMFTSSTAWQVPSGVNKLIVFACAGGGGGSCGTSSGGSGGSTTVVGSVSGSIFALTGGGGGVANGDGGISYAGSGAGAAFVVGDKAIGGQGAGGPFGAGGQQRARNVSYSGEDAKGYGSGGGGGGLSPEVGGSGGGAGEALVGKVISVTGGETLTITIGAGGAGSYQGSYKGGNGTPGMVRFLYFTIS